MTTNQPPPTVDPEDLDRVEELVRYLAGHDGRNPTDDMPLAWWLVDAFDLPTRHPVRQALSGIPLRGMDRGLTPKKAHAWATWLARRDRLVWADRRGQSLDDLMARDSTLRVWVNDMLARHHTGDLGPVETLLLSRTPLWDPARDPDTRNRRKTVAFKVGLNAVRAFHLEHGHTGIPEGHTVAGLDVHAWWQTVRAHYANGVLKDDQRQRMDKLAKLGVDLRTDKQRAKEDPVFRYRDVLAQLAAYIGKFGMSSLPERGEKFVNAARFWIGEYEKSRLDPGLQEALEAIEGWSWDVDVDLAPVRAYAAAYGHLGIGPKTADADGYPVGADLDQLNKNRWNGVYPTGGAKRRGALVDQIADEAWDRAMAAVRAWYREHDGRPAADHVTHDGFHLGAFLVHADAAASAGWLPWARLKQLAQTSGNTGWLETDPAAYAAAMAALERFAVVNRHTHPAWGRAWEHEGEDVDLPRFILRLCADHTAGDLAPSDVLRIESLPGWSWSRRERAKASNGPGRRPAPRNPVVREPVRSVRTDVADPDSQLNRAGLRQFLPAD